MVRGIFAAAGQALVAIIAVFAAGYAVAAPKQTVIHNFSPQPSGAYPASALVADSNGALYGTTPQGGTAGQGAVFKLTPPASGHTDWTESVIYSFYYKTDGGFPTNALTPDGSGGFFGITSAGGAYHHGTIFRLMPPRSGSGAWTEAVLHNLKVDDLHDQLGPLGALVLDASGVLYGVVGGDDIGGTVFKLAPPATSGGSWSFQTLHTFNGGADGLSPEGPLIIGKAGIIYGVTNRGGSSALGTFFELVPPDKGGTEWTETILHNFGSSDCSANGPNGGLIMASDGALYGTGEVGNTGCAFKLTPPTNGQSTWSEMTIPLIIHGAGASAIPNGPLIIDSDGALYGTAASNIQGSPGFVFKLVPPAHAGDDWSTIELCSFNSFGLLAGLVRDANGILYGTALPRNYEFALNQGIVFDVVPPTSGETSWTEHTLFSFRTTDGQFPHSGLVGDSAGNLYGTTQAGGLYGYGTVFKLVPPTAQHPAWTETILHSFNGDDGNYPAAPLMIDAHGAIYGTTNLGGSMNINGGVVFKMTPPAKKGADWSETVIYSFYNTVNSEQESHLATSLVMDKGGSVYGVMPLVGEFRKGQIFKLTPPTSGKAGWSKSIIYNLNTSIVGGGVNLGLIIDDTGALFMTTTGYGNRATAFKLIPPGPGSTSWTPIVIHRFGAEDAPYSPPIADHTGALFGISVSGGAYGKGFAYKLTPPSSAHPDWTETILHSFGEGSDAVNPFAAVTLDKNGAVYGTALSSSVASSNDVVFKLTPPASSTAGWTESLLGQFSPETYEYPTWGIYTTPNGTIYGTTGDAGSANSGTVFQITQ